MANDFQGYQNFALGPEAVPSEHEYKLHCLKHSTSHIMAEGHP